MFLKSKKLSACCHRFLASDCSKIWSVQCFSNRKNDLQATIVSCTGLLKRKSGQCNHFVLCAFDCRIDGQCNVCYGFNGRWLDQNWSYHSPQGGTCPSWEPALVLKNIQKLGKYSKHLKAGNPHWSLKILKSWGNIQNVQKLGTRNIPFAYTHSIHRELYSLFHTEQSYILHICTVKVQWTLQKFNINNMNVGSPLGARTFSLNFPTTFPGGL